MVSLIMTIVAMVPMVAMLTYQFLCTNGNNNIWKQRVSQKNTFTHVGKAAYAKTHLNSINEIPKDPIGKMTKVLSSCDDRMLYYKGRCELDSSKVFCSNSALEGYLILRRTENAERPAGYTRT